MRFAGSTCILPASRTPGQPFRPTWRSGAPSARAATPRHGNHAGLSPCRPAAGMPCRSSGPTRPPTKSRRGRPGKTAARLHDRGRDRDGRGQRPPRSPKGVAVRPGNRPGGVDAARAAALVCLGVVGRRHTGGGDLTARRPPWHDGHRVRVSAPAAAGNPDRRDGHGRVVRTSTERVIVTHLVTQRPGDSAGRSRKSALTWWAILGSNQ